MIVFIIIFKHGQQRLTAMVSQEVIITVQITIVHVSQKFNDYPLLILSRLFSHNRFNRTRIYTGRILRFRVV